MQVSLHVKEAIDEAVLYANLEHKPDVCSHFAPSGAIEEFEAQLDTSFFNVFNQTCGYYQLKRFAATRNEATKLSFIEDATEFRLTDDPSIRLQRAQHIISTYMSSDIFIGGLTTDIRDRDSSGMYTLEEPIAHGTSYPDAGTAELADVVKRLSHAMDENAPASPTHDSARNGYADAMQVEHGGTGLEGLVDPALLQHQSQFPRSVLSPKHKATSPRPGSAGLAGGSGFFVGPPDLAKFGQGEAIEQLLQRSAQHLNGIPCFLLQAYRAFGQRIRHPAIVWKEIHHALSSTRKDAAALSLFDELVVVSMHSIQTVLYPQFLQSACFRLYAHMQYFAHSRPPLTKNSFAWIKPLGRGGYGMVYAAQKLDTGKLYAVKCMDKRMIKSRHATRMIVNERDVLASVDLPFITGLQFAFQDEGEVYFVIDLMSGGDLEYYLLHMSRPFTEAEVQFFAAELFLGIKYLHEHGIMHRDVKPANVLIDSEGHVSLSDLGLAVFFTPAQKLKGAGASGAGSATYASDVTFSGHPSAAELQHGSAAGSYTITSTNSPSLTGASGGMSQPVAAASNCNLPGCPASLVGPLSPGVPTMMLSPFRNMSATATATRTSSNSAAPESRTANCVSSQLAETLGSEALESGACQGAGGALDATMSSTLGSSSGLGDETMADAAFSFQGTAGVPLLGGGTTVSSIIAAAVMEAATLDNSGVGGHHASAGGGATALGAPRGGIQRRGSLVAQYRGTPASPTPAAMGHLTHLLPSASDPHAAGAPLLQHAPHAYKPIPAGPAMSSALEPGGVHGRSGAVALASGIPVSGVHVGRLGLSPASGGTARADGYAPTSAHMIQLPQPTITTTAPSRPHQPYHDHSNHPHQPHHAAPPVPHGLSATLPAIVGGTSGAGGVGVAGRRSSLPLSSGRTSTASGPTLSRTLPTRGVAGRRASLDWDREFTMSTAEGTGVSACEEAGYIFGAQENGVRGKAGTPGYWAPEMLYYERDGKGRRYGPAADWWSFGCTIYALLAARGPFTVIGGDTADDNAATLGNVPDLTLPMFSPTAVSLLQGLLAKDPKARLGCGPGGCADIMNHPFFAGTDWVAMQSKQVPPPFKPSMNVLESTKPVRGWSDKDKAKLATVALTPADQLKYRGIPFVSQKAVYKEIIQNLALREYATEYYRQQQMQHIAALTAAAAAVQHGQAHGGGRHAHHGHGQVQAQHSHGLHHAQKLAAQRAGMAGEAGGASAGGAPLAGSEGSPVLTNIGARAHMPPGIRSATGISTAGAYVFEPGAMQGSGSVASVGATNGSALPTGIGIDLHAAATTAGFGGQGVPLKHSLPVPAPGASALPPPQQQVGAGAGAEAAAPRTTTMPGRRRSFQLLSPSGGGGPAAGGSLDNRDGKCAVM